jgi:CrcB protein
VILLALAVASAVGAVCRYALDRAVQSRHDRVFPFGTLTVNAVGSLLLGLLFGVVEHHGLDPDVRTVLGTGFCGAFTTFSTWGYETVRLVEDGALLEAFGNVAVSLIVGLAAAAAGLGLAQL